METIKKIYEMPVLHRIELDNEISLVLATGEPPAGPGEGVAPDVNGWEQNSVEEHF